MRLSHLRHRSAVSTAAVDLAHREPQRHVHYRRRRCNLFHPAEY